MWLLNYHDQYPLPFVMGFSLFYIAIVSFGLPGAFFLSIAAGFLYGLGKGYAVVLLAANLGSIVSFCLARRFLPQDWLKLRFPLAMNRLDLNLRQASWYDLVALRLMTPIPYALITGAQALGSVSHLRFWTSTLVGMLPVHAFFVLTGSELKSLRDVPDLRAHPLLMSLCGFAVIFLSISFLRARRNTA